MEENLKLLNISNKSYGFIALTIIMVLLNGAGSDFITQSIKHYAIFNAVFYSVVCVMIFSVFSDIINSPESMGSKLRRKLRSRLYFIIFILMPLVAFVDMKAAIMQNNWVF